MRLTKLIVLSFTLVTVSLFSVTAGAIYLEGQAPPDDTSLHILAASSGLAGENEPGMAIPDESAEGWATSMLPASSGYPAMPAFSVPKVPTQTISLGSLQDFKAVVQPSIGSVGYMERLSSLKFPPCQTESPFKWDFL